MANCSLIDEWIKNWCIHTVEYYADLKKKEILKYVTTWMNLKDMMVKELNWSQKDNTAWSHLFEVTKIATELNWKIAKVNIKKWKGGCQGQGEGRVGSS